MENQGSATRVRHWVVPGAILLALGVAAFVYRDALIAWFNPDDGAASGATSDGMAGMQSHETEADQPPVWPEAARAQIARAFEAYEIIRTALSDDTTEGIREAAAELGASIQAAHGQMQDHSAPAAMLLANAANAAETIQGSVDLEGVRSLFGELSRGLIALGALDPELQEGWHVFLCPMGTGFHRWFQRPAQLENPFYGAGMISCGQPSEWDPEDGSASAAMTTPAHTGHIGEGTGQSSSPDEIAFYTCSMHPSVRAHAPGNCPLCGMQLSPVTNEELSSGAVRVDAVRRQRIGVRTGTVERRPVTREIRAVGRVAYDETELHDVTLRVDGWIQRLRVDTTGQEVDRGDALFDLWSPDLYSAQLELLVTQRAGSANSRLLEASRQRLELLGMTSSQIEDLEDRGEVREAVTIRSPASGFVIEKDVVEGDFVMAGEPVYRIASLDDVWVEAEVYEPDLPLVAVGQMADITFPTLPGHFEGRVTYVYPYLQAETRTGRIRIELPNPGYTLRADMYADVHVSVEHGERLVVPASAVIYTGPRRLVFVVQDFEEGLMVPRQIEIGLRAGEDFEVLSGLEEGEVVVTSGNYLIAAESRLRGATEYWGGSGGGGGHAGH